MTSDVTYIDTTPMPAVPSPKPEASLFELTNEKIRSGKLIVISPLVAGEYEIAYIYEQRSDGKFDCLFRAQVDELRMHNNNHSSPPFTL